jgi:hypothetical protein
VFVGVSVFVGVLVGTGVSVGTGDGVRVFVPVGVGVLDGTGVAVHVGVGVLVGVPAAGARCWTLTSSKNIPFQAVATSCRYSRKIVRAGPVAVTEPSPMKPICVQASREETHVVHWIFPEDGSVPPVTSTPTRTSPTVSSPPLPKSFGVHAYAVHSYAIPGLTLTTWYTPALLVVPQFVVFPQPYCPP